MKKVLFIATVDSHIINFHLPYLKLFKDKGYEVHVATNGDDNIPYCDIKHKILFNRNPFSINNLKAIKQLKKLLLDNDFDLVHTNTPVSSTITRLAYKSIKNKINSRIIYTAHGFHFYKGSPIINWLLYYPIEKYLSKYTDTLITINKEDYDIAKTKFKCKDIRYVPGVGIDEKKFNSNISIKDLKDLKESLGLKEKDFIIIIVGELNNNKNQIMCINAIKNLVKKYPFVKLLIVGDGPNKEKIEEKILEYDMKNNIKLLDYRTDVNKLLKISNLCISTSKREGLPCNIMEALASNVPCIVTNCRGNRDLVINNENGYIVNIDDVYDLKSKIEKLITNKKLYNKLKNNKLSSIYLLSNILEEYKEIYGLNTKIPKTINYVWVGKNEKPKNIKKCLETWEKLKDFKVVEWNEDNFDINKHPFCKRAYEQKKWAFVSDYIRAWVIYNNGGIYIDTDVMLLDKKRLPSLLNNSAFIGYESNSMPFTATFGAVKHHHFVKKILDYYDNNLVSNDEANTIWISEILKKDYKCKLGNVEQDLKNDVHIYKKEVLCVPSNDSITVHAFTATWVKKISIFSKLCTFLRINSNYKICRFIYSNLIVPIKEKKNEKIYNNNNSNI